MSESFTQNAAGDRLLHGILNVDKPLGLTSHDIVARLRRITRQRQVGHAGTLDPLATGVLLVCLGQATRVSQYLMDSPKTYQAIIHLGISTKTLDAEGDVTSEKPVSVTRQQVEAALGQFVGHIEQVPPMYSAIKKNGKKLYELARQGITVERPPREVDIYALRITTWARPLIHVTVECGPGTYIRALAHDIGIVLGCGAHLAALRRTRSGSFFIEQAVTIEQLEAGFANDSERIWLYPLDAALANLPMIHLDQSTAFRLALGQSIHVSGDVDVGTIARAYGPDGRFIALVKREKLASSWRPVKVFVKPNTILVSAE
ncbi:MAG: tRNA pseudouridine(55) synthase TruB [Anaerolineae bacterium]|nr:tRNA pseudouridine(55) synthase TruB [Anaerolineae bacterium]